MTIIAIAYIAVAIEVKYSNAHKQSVSIKDLVDKQFKAVTNLDRNTIINH